ncbi:hypothetical protein [Mycolicibacterium hodleri]|uniref:Uncharacterized protein n=1 Tax=Mycolicibacterium hodleri TaxID=49897 RepID=A0A502EBM9_9MYCO|nr:hypothetical protein [Mycolicibacterium hodleri]TPG34342.1 hypothetical protein EAH80_12255 [Mycolicibacterium hodleri]
MARTSLTSGDSTFNASQFNTAIITPGANTLVLMFVASARSAPGGATPTKPRASGNGLTWESIQTVTTGGDRRLTCFRAFGAAPTAGAVTIDFADQIQDLCAWSIFEYDGVNTTAGGVNAIGQSKSGSATGTTLTITLDTPSDPARNTAVGAIMLALNIELAQSITAGSGFVQIHQQNPNKLAGRGATLQTQDATAGNSGVNWTWNASEPAVGIVVEVKAAPVGGTDPGGTDPGGTNPGGTGSSTTDPVALAKHFEPVLFFDPAESHFPVDAKRYVEAAALWSAGPAFDDHNTWGGAPGASFPRNPLVPAGQLRAMPNEGGTHLGSKPEFVVADAAHERFLEFGGWKDNADPPNHEAAVTAATTNLYADRAKIVADQVGALDGARRWYHAEFFDSARLTRLFPAGAAPDLGALLKKQFTNPAMLCYYFFFPAHEQGVGADTCDTVDATEVSCHAGDWQCVALLLESDGSGVAAGYAPKFFGYTGLRPAPRADGSYAPYQFDAEDRVAMKVLPWRKGTDAAPVEPAVDGETHPRFFVARGSHSLYTGAGNQELDPYVNGAHPNKCGQLDSGEIVPPPPHETDDKLPADLVMVLTKTFGGGLLGTAWGFISAMVELIAGIEEFGGAAPADTSDTPNDDIVPTAANAGVVLAPGGVTVADGGPDPERWSTAQQFESNGRRYDFIVDRASQLWWPADDGQSGFRGRWGQRVQFDPLGRRSGPKFPDFVRMFLLAVASGETELGLDG